MDTFDSIDLGVFAFICLLLMARMTFWKRNGKLRGFWECLPNILLLALPCLDFSLVHHWNMPHRRRYQFILQSSMVFIGLWKTIQFQLKGRRQDREKQAQKAGRRYY